MIHRACDIARDLMPLAIDGLCSPGSESFLNEHLTSCEACRKVYDSLKHPIPAPPAAAAEAQALAASLRKTGKRFRHRTVMTVVSLALVATLVLLSFVPIPIPMTRTVQAAIVQNGGSDVLPAALSLDGWYEFHLFDDDVFRGSLTISGMDGLLPADNRVTLYTSQDFSGCFVYDNALPGYISDIPVTHISNFLRDIVLRFGEWYVVAPADGSETAESLWNRPDMQLLRQVIQEPVQRLPTLE